MSRVESTFARLKAGGGTGLVTYVTAGDPDLAQSADILRRLDAAGADVLEVGVPFSDPLADGPVIQRAAERALRQKTTLGAVLEMVAGVRADIAAPIVLFTYVNPILRVGVDRFSRQAAAAGVDAVLALDLPVEEADDLNRALTDEGLDMIFLVTPTSTSERIRRAAALGRGFLYAVSRLGVTGARAQLADVARPLVERIRAETQLPVAVGFGVSRPEHVAEIGTFAEAAVVGSALVSVVEECESEADLPERIAERVRWLKGAALRGAGADRAPRAVAEDAASIDAWRDRVDNIDAAIVRLLNERASCALTIGDMKTGLGLPVYQPDRERDVIARARALTTGMGGPLKPDAIARLFERIIDEARVLELARQAGADADTGRNR